MKKLKNDNRMDKLVKFDGEGIGQEEENKIKIQKGIKERKSGELLKYERNDSSQG